MTDGLSRRSVPHTLHGIVEFTSTARVLVWASMLLDIAANCRYFRLPVWKLSRFESGLLGMLTYGLSRLTATHLAPKWSSEPTKMGFWYAAFCFPRVGVEMTLEI